MEFSVLLDERGYLLPFELSDLPIECVRIFFVGGAIGVARGEHAHKKCRQYFVCVSGALRVEAWPVDGRDVTTTTVLRPDGKGFLLNRGVFSRQIALEERTVLAVFCDMAYDPSDYIYLEG